MKPSDVKLCNYVSFEMKVINDLTTELYEEMMDKNDDEVVVLCNKLSQKISGIRKDHSKTK